MNLLKKSGEKKTEYKYLGKESLRDNLRNTIPRELLPSNLTGKIMGYIFLIVILISLFQFSTGSFIGKGLTKKINIGIPRPFLEFDLLNPSGKPLNKKGLIIDLFAYLFLAYAIEVFINLFKDTHLLDSKKEKNKIPKVFETEKKKNLHERLTKKAFEKIGVKNLINKKEKNSNSNLNNSSNEKTKINKTMTENKVKTNNSQKNLDLQKKSPSFDSEI